MKRRSNIKNLAAALLVVAKEIDAVDEVQRSIKLVLELLKKDAQFRAFMPVSYTHLTLPTNREV